MCKQETGNAEVVKCHGQFGLVKRNMMCLLFHANKLNVKKLKTLHIIDHLGVCSIRVIKTQLIVGSIRDISIPSREQVA